MDERFYRDRARVLRELATEADPFIRKRLLRLASSYDDMTAGQKTGGQERKTPAQGSEADSLDGN
ncbi:hypothetical protein [Bradyrhizobium sp.]|jgi:hypothetical protein|uniref:hypothetical protein n=1 Tax=Bradyrhizobium sp. TaxID=376 RepID=UPI002B5ED0EA|nr:hypothetical protein [Bradyrhizobium sp.]HMM87590.1 hypothetical protein [Bradyrhizobium sp.]